MDQKPADAPREPCAPVILAALEIQLAALDGMGAHMAAAHLDAAIQQFRLDQAWR